MTPDTGTILLDPPIASRPDWDDATTAALTDLPDFTTPDPEDSLPAPEPLLRAISAPPPHALEDLQAVVDRRRIIVVRLGLGISAATIFSVVAALFLHALFAAGLYLSAFWYVATHGRGHVTADTEIAEGGSGGGSLIFTDQKNGLSGDAHAAAPQPGPLTPAQPSILPATPSPPHLTTPTPEASAPGPNALALLTNDNTNIIGLPGATGGLSTPKPLPPRNIAPVLPTPAPPVIGPSIVMTLPPTHPTAPVAVASAKPATPGTGITSLGGAGDDAGDNDFRPRIDLTKKGSGSGNGNGKGNGSGDETDRGPSGANLNSVIISWGTVPELSPELQVQLIGKSMTFTVTVSPDGRATDIKIKKSSGNADLDALYRSSVATARFRPRYVEGKPVTYTTDVSYGSETDQ